MRIGALLRPVGRRIVAWVLNRLEPERDDAAPSVVSLKLAQLTGARSEDYILAEIAQLRRLPGLMQKVLARRAEIGASARRLLVVDLTWVHRGPPRARPGH